MRVIDILNQKYKYKLCKFIISKKDKDKNFIGIVERFEVHSKTIKVFYHSLNKEEIKLISKPIFGWTDIIELID